MSTYPARLSARLKALADPIRMRLVVLCRHGECSVSELTEVLGLSQPRVSQHLKRLCDAELLHRFRDGQWVYYRVPGRAADAETRRLLDLIATDEPLFREDRARLQALRGESIADIPAERVASRPGDRALHKALVELTVTTRLGDLLDVGCGRGAILKLLASRARRAVGVDIDSDARRLARTELMLAGLPNCSLRRGDMYRLPFGDDEFDTVVLDDVLADATHPVRVMTEASRVLKPDGRLFVLLAVNGRSTGRLQVDLADWSASAGLRIAPARIVPRVDPEWIVSVATLPGPRSAAA